MSSGQPEIFDRKRRQALQDRAARRGGHESFLWQYIADDLAERLAIVTRDFADVAFIGPIGKYADVILGERRATVHLFGLASDGIEEDRFPLAPQSYDLIVSAGTLDSVNDLPGALIQIRHTLRPDGLFLGHMFGAGTLATLKSILLSADGSRAVPHIHPQIDLNSAADLMSRAGFAMPVVDQDSLGVAYGSWRTLVDDLRDMGAGKALAGPMHYPGGDYLCRIEAAWSDARQPDGKIHENFVHIHMSGWAPSPDQPKPAKRGSGVSLATILPQPRDIN